VIHESWAYVALVAFVGLERLVEMVLSRRNGRRLVRRGAIELGRRHYPWMVVLHVAFLVACPLEVFALGRPFLPWLGWPMVVLVAASMGLRYWVVATLGERWNTRVICLPGEPLIGHGPYRWIRHPNYVAVVVELAALPLVHSAWCTALVFGLANALVLRARLRVENAALARFPALAGVERT